MIKDLNVQVNVSQELLPSLLHTARCFKIKGLDNVQPPPGLVEQNVSAWCGDENAWNSQDLDMLLVGENEYDCWCFWLKSQG